MADFDPVGAVVPVKPSRLQIVFDVVEKAPGSRDYAGSFDFRIPTSDGSEFERRQGDLVPHLTNQQKTAIVAFLDAMLDKARATVP